MEIRTINLPTGDADFTTRFALDDIKNLTFEAVHDLNKQIAEKIASKVYKDNKKKIISAIDIDLITAEIQKIVVEKVKEGLKKKSN